MRPLPSRIHAASCRRLPSIRTAARSVGIGCAGLLIWDAQFGPIRAADPPALLPEAHFRVHEPRELLAGGDERLFHATSGLQLAAWESDAATDRAQLENTTTAATGPIADDPLSRIQWPEADTGVDAGATLRGLAEGAGLFLAIAVVGLWVLRQWLVKRSLVEGAGRHLRRVDSLSLPQRCHVHLLDVQGRRVLVAIDSGGVKGVTVLPDSFDQLIEPPADDAASRGDETRRSPEAFAAPTFA
jgi:flagellar biogenesis protein FliO